MKLESRKMSYQLEISGQYLSKPASDVEKVRIVLLHGFQQTAEVFFRLLGDIWQEDEEVIGLNGPFHFPSMSSDGLWQIGYSWYFYNHQTSEYLVDQKPAAKYIHQFIDSKEWSSDIPIVIIGYSQGGYLLPYISQEIPSLKHYIGLNSRLRDEEFIGSDLNGQYVMLNGENDRLVSHSRSQSSSKALVETGADIKFVSVPNADHKLGSALTKELRLTIDEIKNQ